MGKTYRDKAKAHNIEQMRKKKTLKRTDSERYQKRKSVRVDLYRQYM